MLDAAQQLLLGQFIRARRERILPANPLGRRRTPGMRREELAAEAGISTTWCAWIEQGREVRASPRSLGRIARALALSAAERAYLFEIAGQPDPDGATPAGFEAPPSLLAAVAAVAHPAYGLDRLWNACCWNEPAQQLFRGWLDGKRERNLLRFVFLDPSARALIPDWEDRALQLLAEFRADYGRAFRDAGVTALVDALNRESALFARGWATQDVRPRAGGLRVFNRPESGELQFVQHTFSPSDRPDYKLVMLVPT